MTQGIRSVLIALILAGFFHSSGLALTNEEIFSQFQFNFITPGARATALGGAFIGLADDATAVESNPAGLTILAAPEIFAEFKHLAYTTEQIYENLPISENLDSETGVFATDITRKEFGDSVESIPFVSAVYPYKRFVFSLYRQELVNYKSSYRTSPRPIAVPGTRFGIHQAEASVELAVTNYGIGAAVEIFKGFSLAVSPRWAEMDMNSHFTRFRSESFIDPTDFSDDDAGFKSEIDDGDSGFCINVGGIWRPHPKVSIGAVYRTGPTFTVTSTRFGQYSAGYDPDSAEFTLKVPDSYGAGVAFRATGFLTFTLDVVHIRYEDLLKDFDIVTDPYVYTKENYSVENATEVHFGVEYILALGERFLALRAGIYNDPDHTIRFTGTTGETVFDIAGREKFLGGDDQIHVTGGLGLVVNDRLQIDTAANIAGRYTQLSLSAVYRF